MKVGVITLFPEAIEFYKNPEAFGLAAKACQNQVELVVENLRLHGEGKHQTVDDSPYGGGDGMVLKADPVQKAYRSLLEKMGVDEAKVKSIYLSPKGQLWTQPYAEKVMTDLENKNFEALILLCGRYAGVDQRVIDLLFDEEVSVGPFILNGGELPALCLIESLIRLIPGSLGNTSSALKDSFSKGQSGKLEPPSYTRPRVWEGLEVPEILLSGDHKRLEEHRTIKSEEMSEKWREGALKSLKGLFD